MTSQKPDQWLASKFKGTDVIGTDNKKIGDVSDILFDKAGKIEAFVVSVGGFLGIGAKDVALAPTAFEVVQGRQTARATSSRLAMTQGRAQAGAELRAVQGAAATTGAGTSGVRADEGASGASSRRRRAQPNK